MNMKNRIYFLFTFSMLCHAYAFAQTDSIRTERIDVIKPFKALLSESIKIQSNPNPEVPEVKKPDFSYKLPELRHTDIPTVYTIKPLSLGTSLLPKLKNNYTRLGYGNYNTPLFEVYMNSKRNKDAQYGLFYKHLSSSPDANRTFSNNTASVYGKRFMDNSILETDLMYHRNAVTLYGYEREKLNPVPDAIRNIFSLYDAKIALSNIAKDTSKLQYKLGMHYYHYAAFNNLTENNFVVNGNFMKRIDGNPFDIQTGVQLNNTANTQNTYNRVFVDVNPQYRLNFGSQLHLSVGFNSTFFNDSNGTDFHFYPKVDAGYQIIPKALTLFAGITGGLQRHTIRSITTENPFARGLFFENTLNQFESYIGMKGLISPQTSFLLRASYANIKNLLFYGADSSFKIQETIYDNSSSGLAKITAELNHDFLEIFRFGFNMNYYRYDLSINAPFSRPTFTTATNLSYNMAKKFIIRSEIFTMNERTGIFTDTKKEVKLDGIIDLNMGLEYRYSGTVALFLNINNITNNQYERWIGLPVYGINVIGGLGVTF